MLTVIRKARSKAEYRNIFQHMTIDGSKDAGGWQPNEAQVQEFLTLGADMKDLDVLMRRHERSLASIYDRLYDQPVLGHPFMDNDEPRYLANALRGDHDGFRVAGGYNPGPQIPAFDRNGWNDDEADTRYA